VGGNIEWRAAGRPCLTRLVISGEEVVALLAHHWGLTNAEVSVLGGGMGSETWLVTRPGNTPGRWVAKLVEPGNARPLEGGLGLARLLEEAGIPAGAPVPARSGRDIVDVEGGALVLLRWVPGNPLTGDSPAEQETIGTTLARVHLALAVRNAEDAERFHWVDPAADYLGLRPWLRPAITSALAQLDAARPEDMTWGLLHADPAPGAFRLDSATGRCGVIDWSYLLHGPLLYDLASAAMYVGGPSRAAELVTAYLRHGPLDRAEIAHGLHVMLRFRWAVQANYFAWRIARNDLTGISGPEENEKGLEDARVALAQS
jgi:Ser/Thr protein kinase RdoA (MazF antagonist)